MKAKVLLIGSGGRENCLAWKLCQSNHVSELVVAPGNAGTHRLGMQHSVLVIVKMTASGLIESFGGENIYRFAGSRQGKVRCWNKTTPFDTVQKSNPILNEYEKLACWCSEEQMDLVIVGPEDPLARGIADSLEKYGDDCVKWCFSVTSPMCIVFSQDNMHFSGGFPLSRHFPTICFPLY